MEIGPTGSMLDSKKTTKNTKEISRITLRPSAIDFTKKWNVIQEIVDKYENEDVRLDRLYYQFAPDEDLDMDEYDFEYERKIINYFDSVSRQKAIETLLYIERINDTEQYIEFANNLIIN